VAHEIGIVHRDLKPANVFMVRSGDTEIAKVLDFGIATGAGSRDAQPDGTVLGTPAYLAPERLLGKSATPATDMFALGVLLYHCLAGRLPWPAATNTELIEAQRYRDPDPLPPIEALAPEVADLCARCLRRDPRERPSALVAALLLAETVDARVYVPLMDPALPPRSGPVSPWDRRAAEAPTSAALPSEPDGVRVGRHRA
jgi:serine/threonine-protein kinase